MQAPKQKTLTELVAGRRKAFIPDISFDLDGDGIVSREDWTASIKVKGHLAHKKQLPPLGPA